MMAVILYMKEDNEWRVSSFLPKEHNNSWKKGTIDKPKYIEEDFGMLTLHLDCLKTGLNPRFYTILLNI